MAKKRLNLIKTNFSELSDKWKCSYGVVRNTFNHEQIYIMCDKDGNVNWDKNPVYRASELVERDNVKILKLNNGNSNTRIVQQSKSK